MLDWHKQLNRLQIARRGLVLLAHSVLIVCSAVCAFLLRFDLGIPVAFRPYLFSAVLVLLPIKLVVFHFFKLDRGLWRYLEISDLVRVALGNLTASALGGVAILLLTPSGFSRSIVLLDLMVCLIGTSGLRMIVRTVMVTTATGRLNRNGGKRVFIYGAGDAGIRLLHEISVNQKLSYLVCGFIDDRPDKKGLRLGGIRVLGGGDELEELIAKYGVETILVTIPSATGPEMTRILELCQQSGVECKTVPGMAEIIEGRGLTRQIREVAVEDLLGRVPIHLEEGEIRETIANKVVMVTGAAGSIGSELCRQIARFGPAGIVGFEMCESPLFEIDREMKERFPDIPFHPEIGSIQNPVRLNEVMDKYRPKVLYHAAAYKHVPLMETHVFEAVENNVFGTHNVAIAAVMHGVEDFVMISSDKAVRPTNIMGTTKRVAELLLLGIKSERTRFIAVRFGNVLGSNGSVIPIFKKQIAAGGPVTVTHPEMRRFFMTIPEACQLVLQASAIGESGQICVLDMGQPVKIVDLAKNLILLSGLRMDTDIKIEFTGTRPGEKLFEELSSLLEDTVPSEHEKIRIFMGPTATRTETQRWLKELEEICESRDVGRLVVVLKEIVLDYSPSSHLLRRAISTPRRSTTQLQIEHMLRQMHA